MNVYFSSKKECLMILKVKLDAFYLIDETLQYFTNELLSKDVFMFCEYKYNSNCFGPFWEHTFILRNYEINS